MQTRTCQVGLCFGKEAWFLLAIKLKEGSAARADDGTETESGEVTI